MQKVQTFLRLLLNEKHDLCHPGRIMLENVLLDLKTKPQAAVMLHDQLEPLYQKLQDSIEAEVNWNKTKSQEGAQQMQEAVAGELIRWQ